MKDLKVEIKITDMKEFEVFKGQLEILENENKDLIELIRDIRFSGVEKNKDRIDKVLIGD